MSDGRNNPGMSALADVLSAGINRENGMDKVLDFGEILWDGSLLCNTYKVCVPKECYMVCVSYSLPDSEVITSYSTTAKNNSHKHMFDDALILAGTTDTQSSPDAHAHTTQTPMVGIETKSVTVTQKPHDHEVDIARASQRHMRAGDHVLVAWVGYDACVIDRIVPATMALEGRVE